MTSPSPTPPRRNPALRLAAVRQWHTYLGVLIAPSVLFFAVTGALQLFSLHEAHGDYRPPAIVEGMASVHKDQVYKVEAAHPEPPPGDDAGKAAGVHDDHDHDHGPPKISTLALKWLFLAVAGGLVVSTGLGLWMALQFGRRRPVLWALLAAGVVLPVLLVLI